MTSYISQTECIGNLFKYLSSTAWLCFSELIFAHAQKFAAIHHLLTLAIKNVIANAGKAVQGTRLTLTVPKKQICAAVERAGGLAVAGAIWTDGYAPIQLSPRMY